MSENQAPVRIAVVGAGAMGRNHIRFVTEEASAERGSRRAVLYRPRCHDGRGQA